MKILIAPDSFKGCLDSYSVCRALGDGFARGGIDIADITFLPLADGGEGSAGCIMSALGGEMRNARVHSPFYEMMTASYAAVELDGVKTAVIESAAACSLEICSAGGFDIMHASSVGVGELICRASEECGEIVAALGGSGTNDGGIGAMAALGCRFYNARGVEINIQKSIAEVDVARTLASIAKIDASFAQKRFENKRLRLLYDAGVPLCGDGGATMLFSAQKGANRVMRASLENAMQSYRTVLQACDSCGTTAAGDFAALNEPGTGSFDEPGTGSSGGLGAGLMLCSGELVPGAQTILDITGFDEKCASCDIVVTGEGKTDAQSLCGKLPVTVAHRAFSLGKKTLCVCGSYEPDERLDSLFSGIFPIQRAGIDKDESIRRAAELLSDKAYEIARRIK